MSDKCGKCDLEISQTKDGSKCPDCNIMFHLKCLNPGFAESGKKVTRKNAKCDSCLSDTSSTASQVRDVRELNLTSVMDAIAAFRNASSILKGRRLKTACHSRQLRVTGCQGCLAGGEKKSEETVCRHPSFPDHQVYMNDHLTSHTRAIFNGARELMKAGKLSSVWTSDRRILAKKHEGRKPFRILHQQHLYELRAASYSAAAKSVPKPANPLPV
ncbi:hypothetical protein J6590_005396 [Homalodisca vitripennis]|nr:hypothetical protein J6590_005396 [Homalodisca vitripennis]